MPSKRTNPPEGAGPALPLGVDPKVTPAFRLVFFSVLGLTLLSLAASVYLVLREKQTDEIKRLAETCSTTWKLGFGAIVGLIGGKAL